MRDVGYPLEHSTGLLTMLEVAEDQGRVFWKSGNLNTDTDNFENFLACVGERGIDVSDYEEERRNYNNLATSLGAFQNYFSDKANLLLYNNHYGR